MKMSFRRAALGTLTGGVTGIGWDLEGGSRVPHDKGPLRGKSTNRKQPDKRGSSPAQCCSSADCRYVLLGNPVVHGDSQNVPK